MPTTSRALRREGARGPGKRENGGEAVRGWVAVGAAVGARLRMVTRNSSCAAGTSWPKSRQSRIFARRRYIARRRPIWAGGLRSARGVSCSGRPWDYSSRGTSGRSGWGGAELRPGAGDAAGFRASAGTRRDFETRAHTVGETDGGVTGEQLLGAGGLGAAWAAWATVAMPTRVGLIPLCGWRYLRCA